MAKFIQPLWNNSLIGKESFANVAVNLDLVQSFHFSERLTHGQYYHNMPRVYMLEFIGTQIVWNFSSNEQRMQMYNKILKTGNYEIIE